MMRRRLILAASFAILAGSTIFTVAQERKEAASASQAPASERNQQGVAPTNGTAAGTASTSGSSAVPPDAVHSGILDARAMRIEGEKRFRANCSRCHMAPHKFPPRAMATVVRHMRVRAMLTDEDMKFILSYLTQ